MAITEAKPAEAITIRLDFVEPMEGTSTVGFQFQPKDQATEVVWSMSGDQGFVERLLCTVMGVDVEAMIGQDYERGLANLKTVAEAVGPAAAPVEPASPPALTPPG
jgi:hypothetical protein